MICEPVPSTAGPSAIDLQDGPGGEQAPQARDSRFPEDIPVGETRLLTCAHCERQWEWTSEEGHQTPRVYCKRSCKNRAAAGRRVAPHTLETAVGDDIRLLICSGCGVTFGWRQPFVDPDAAPPTFHTADCSKRSKKRLARIAKLLGQPRNTVPLELVAASTEVLRQQALTTQQVDRLLIEAREAAERAVQVAAESAAARELLLPASHCLSCAKVAAPTKEAAKEMKRAVERRTGHESTVRYYRCPDGFWHWTRMNADLEGAHGR